MAKAQPTSSAPTNSWLHTAGGGSAPSGATPPTMGVPAVAQPVGHGRRQGLTSQLTPDSVQVDPGAEARLQVRVRNTGEIVEGAAVSVDGVPSSWIRIDPPLINLDVGAEGTADVFIRPPKAAATRAGAHSLAVTASSSVNPAVRHQTTAAVHVGMFSQLDAAIDPPSKQTRSRADFILAVRNDGNATDRVDVTLADSQGGLQLMPQALQLQVAPGDTVTTRVSAQPRRSNWFGQPQQHGFTVDVRSGGTPVKSIHGSVMQLRRLPGWLPRAATAVLTIMLAAAGVLAAFLLTGDRDDGTGTATTSIAPDNNAGTGSEGDTPESTATGGGGDASTTSSTDAAARMPDVTKLKEASAKRELELVGVEKENVKVAYHYLIGADDTVILTDPDVGAEISREQTVTLHVGRPSPFTSLQVELSKPTAPNPSGIATAEVKCATGTALAGGFRVQGGAGFTLLESSPIVLRGHPVGWKATLQRLPNTTTNLTLVSSAVCGKISQRELRVVQKTETTPANQNRNSASCGSDAQALGGGFLLQAPDLRSLRVLTLGTAEDLSGWDFEATSSAAMTSTVYSICLSGADYGGSPHAASIESTTLESLCPSEDGASASRAVAGSVSLEPTIGAKIVAFGPLVEGGQLAGWSTELSAKAAPEGLSGMAVCLL